MRKTLLVTNIPTPYRIPLFRELSEALRRAGWQLKVVFAAPTYERRKWKLEKALGFDHTILGTDSNRIGSRYNPVFTYPGLLRVLRLEKPDVAIVAGFSIATLKTALWSLISGRPLVIWSGSIAKDEGVLRRLYRALLARKASAAVCYGSLARGYLKRLGMREERAHIAINTVDVAFFRDRAAGLAEHDGGRAGAPRHILYVGDLIQRKRVDLLLHAVKELSRRRHDFVVDIIGQGALEKPLQRLAEDLGIGPFVRFEGFKQREELPAYLARASTFVFPTESDVWGLVLIEAMAAGLPCVASIRAGATADVIQEGLTGFAVDFHDRKVVADRLDWLLEHPEEAAEIGRRASRFVSERMSLEASASGFVRAVRQAAREEAVQERVEAVYELS